MNEKLYYYTDINTFKLILKNGTLRFKESTSSNDNLDTVQLHEHLVKMARDKIHEKEITPEEKFYYDMINHIGSKHNRITLVACFTSKKDSRMLWDAYTMHRKDREAERYNGVCIEFDRSKLVQSMNANGLFFDDKSCQEIVYGFEKIDPQLEKLVEEFSAEVDKLSKDDDQTQNIIKPIPVPLTRKEVVLKKCIVIPVLHLSDKFDRTAPFYKHAFWGEESEIRAVLSMKTGSKYAMELSEYDDGSRYYDLKISPDSINKVILGPEFLPEDVMEVSKVDGNIAFDMLQTEMSSGTGVITNR